MKFRAELMDVHPLLAAVRGSPEWAAIMARLEAATRDCTHYYAESKRCLKCGLHIDEYMKDPDGT